MSTLSATDHFTMAHNTLNRVDTLLVAAGFKQDSSIRHQLQIAKSMFREAERLSKNTVLDQIFEVIADEKLAWVIGVGDDGAIAACNNLRDTVMGLKR